MAEAERILSQNEVDALLSAIDSGTQVGGGDDTAAAYDFRHPARLGRDRIRGLQLLHEGFARSLQTALAGLLRASAEVKVAGVHALSMTEALHSLPRPTVLTVLSCAPLDGYFLLDMNPSIAGPAIERLLGSGKAGPPSDPRPLTALEWGVYETLLGTILDLLREAWAPVADLSFRVVRRESDPGALQLPRLEEMAVMVALEAVVGDQRGSLDIVFPVYAVEPFLSRLQTVPAPAAKPDVDGEGGLPGRISPAEVTVSADLPTETARLEDIRELKAGDLIVSSHPATAPVIVSVEGCAKFQARLGRMKDRRAAKIEKDVVADEARQARASVIRGPGGPAAGETPAVDVLLAVPLGVSVVLAEKRATLREVLATRPGEMITFDRRADAPLELRVGGRRIAEGSAVRVGERFGLKIGAIADARDRVRALGR